jgi:uncharacterized repeat protein (TIGR02543 family)
MHVEPQRRGKHRRFVFDGAKTSSARRRTLFQGLAAVVGVMVVIAGVGLGAVEPTQAAVSKCDGTSSQNNLTVTAKHGSVFYIDSGQGQNVDAAYASYSIKNTSGSTQVGLWASVDSFTGTSVTLANPLDASQGLGDVAGSAFKSAFFLLKAKGSSTSAQTHQLHVFSGKPGAAGSTPLYTCTFTFVKVAETIKAQANKVSDVVNTTVTSLGSTFTMTVTGATGTIGAGSAIDPNTMSFSPVARSSWPTSAFRLESTEIRFYNNKSYNGASLIGTYSNTLSLKQKTVAPTDTSLYYIAVYTFRIIGPTSSTAVVAPIAQIASGTQTKHTDVSSSTGFASSIAAVSPTTSLAVTKSVSGTTTLSADKTIFSYTVLIANTGSAAASVDQVIDTPDPALTYVADSAKFAGVAVANPSVSPTDSTKLLFAGPYNIANGATGLLTYKMSAVTCSSGTYSYRNSAVATVGSLVIGSTATTSSVLTVTGTCNTTSDTSSTSTQALPVQAVTGAVDTIADTSAKVYGNIYPTGNSGTAITFDYGTSSTLATSTSVTATPSLTAGGTTSVPVSANITGLTAGTIYYYRVRVGSVTGGILSFGTTKQPTNPTALTTPATDITDNAAAGMSAVLNGIISPNQTATQYKFFYGLDSSNGSCTSFTTTYSSYSTTGFIQDETPANIVLQSLYPVSVDTASPTTGLSTVTGLTKGSYYCFDLVGYYGTSYSTPTDGTWVSFKASVQTAQTITFSPPADLQTESTQPAGATASSGLAVTYSSNTPEICSVSSSGAITGIAGGTCSITASQAGDSTYSAAIPMTVSFLVVAPPVVTNTGLVDGTAGTAYSQQLTATGGDGVGTYSSWTVAAGSLPPGLSLNSATGAITGTPTTIGVYSITFTVVSQGLTSVQKILSITIANTVTFDTNGGSGSLASQSGSSAAALTPNEGNISRSGYTFAGWNTAANGSGTSYADGASYPFTSSTTLYAQWTAAANTVTFNANDGTGSPATETQPITTDVSTALRANTFTRTGYTFAGWTTVSDGTGTSYTNSQSVTLSGPLTVYAKWTANSNTVTFNANDGTVSPATETQSITTAVSTALRTNTFTRTGYSFGGWTTVSDGSGTSYTNSQLVTITGPFTLYAKWTADSNTVTFNANDGTGSPATATQSITTGVSTALRTNTFSRTGYTFGGWTRAADGTGTSYTDSQPVTISGPFTVYAKWTADSNTITFNANDGTGSPATETQSITTAVATALRTNTFTRTGFTFAGWTAVSDGSGTSYTNSQLVTISGPFTVYAKWTADSNSITFNANDETGSPSTVTQSITTAVSTALRTNTFTRTGYTFAGWTTVSDGTGTSYTNSQLVTITGPFTLYAKWTAASNTVTFNANAGTGSPSTVTQGITTAVSTALRANTFTRTGYTFAGWTTVSDGSGTSYTNSQLVTLSAPMTLYAKWTADSNTITFNANDGTESPATQTQSITTAVSTALRTNTFTRVGHSFGGWTTAADGAGVSYSNSQLVTVSGPLTLYAKWSVWLSTVTFDANDGSGTIASQSGATSAALTSNSGSISRPGYTFTGWNTAANGSGTSYLDGASYPFTSSATLYAQWTADSNTVTFNANDGTGSPSTVTQSITTAVSTALRTNTFTRTGYTFAGWTAAADGTGTSYTNSQSVTISGPFTVYAKWTADSNTITFNSNDGTRSPATTTQSITTAVATALRANTFTRAGYTFGGWTTVSDGSGIGYANSQSVTIAESFTVYAKWAQNYVVSYNGNGATDGSAPSPESGLGSFVAADNTGSLVRPGYIFAGWNTQPDGDGTSYAVGARIPDGANIVLYANWAPVASPTTSQVGTTSTPPAVTPSSAAPTSTPTPTPTTAPTAAPTAAQTAQPIAQPTAQSRVASLTQIAGEEISGFAPSAGITVQVTGAKTVGQFVLSSTDATTWAGVAAALNESAARNGASFARIPNVSTSTTTPASHAYFNGPISPAVEDVYSQSGLPKPRSVRDLPTNSTTWLHVVGNVSGYVAGSTVYINVESQPTIFQSATVNNRGEAVLDGYLPLGGLEAGPHTLRVVGTRQISGVFSDSAGKLQLSDEAVSAIQQFDQGTKATVVLSGEGVSGANLSVSRVVYLDKDIAWWTLYLAVIIAFLGLVLVLVRRRAHPLLVIVTASIVTLSAVPATVIGWTSASYELWWAIPVGLGVSFICLFLTGAVRLRRSARRTPRASQEEPRGAPHK